MPIESPRLDDLTFNQLEQMLRSKISVYAPEWTDHNDSDPGITMIQLFSHLGEQLSYRLNQVPEKNYLEFLKLVGITLEPARPASTLMNFILSTPESVEQFLIPRGSKINAKSEADEPPVFETNENLDVIPAQLAALVTTRADGLTQINTAGETGPTDAGDDVQDYIDQRFSLAWDGKSPKLKDMPTAPVSLMHRPSESTHTYVWIGLAFNQSVTAGFLGSRVNLHLQLDNDEQPTTDASTQCGSGELEIVDISAPDDDLVRYRYYRPPQLGETTGSWQDLNVIGDTTQGWTISGQVRFDVPSAMGPIPDPEWEEVEEGELHPLIGALKNPVRGAPELVPVSGWLSVEFKTPVPAISMRAISFNVTEATSAVTVINEQLGIGTGKPNQRLRLQNGNVLAETLEVITISLDASREVIEWTAVDSFDGVDPFATVYVLDCESGDIAFGDKVNGMPPSEIQRVLARRYRHGGGLDNDADVGLVNQPASFPSPVDAAVNIVAASGGVDAETLEQAKKRAPSEMQSQERAVTVADFEFHAMQAESVRLGRVEVVTFHKPYNRLIHGTLIPMTGLDFDTHIPGVVAVIAVPDELGLYPTSTEGSLRKVCRHLDQYRLLTTEVYTTVPQYVRVFNLDIELLAAPGYTRTKLREAIAEKLETYFHVLNGGEDGEGFPFGSTVHHADFVAQVFRVEGVARVEGLSANFDGYTPDNAALAMNWRIERLQVQNLTNCIRNAGDNESIQLAADENIFVDSSSLNIRFTGD